LSENKTLLSTYFSETSWLQHLAYFADIFNKLNEFNLRMQDHGITLSTGGDEVAAAKLKLKSL
jgi:hypothetical protein